MSQVKIETVMADWSEVQKDFGNIIIQIVEQKYEDLKERHPDRVSLENITLKPYYFVGYYVGHMQHISKMKGKSLQSPIITANNMLSELCRKGELYRYREGIYRVNKTGELYKFLEEVLGV